MDNPETPPSKQIQHALKAISAAIIALVGVVMLAVAVLASPPSLPIACLGIAAIGFMVVGLVTWIWQVTRS